MSINSGELLYYEGKTWVRSEDYVALRHENRTLAEGLLSWAQDLSVCDGSYQPLVALLREAAAALNTQSGTPDTDRTSEPGQT